MNNLMYVYEVNTSSLVKLPIMVSAEQDRLVIYMTGISLIDAAELGKISLSLPLKYINFVSHIMIEKITENRIAYIYRKHIKRCYEDFPLNSYRGEYRLYLALILLIKYSNPTKYSFYYRVYL